MVQGFHDTGLLLVVLSGVGVLASLLVRDPAPLPGSAERHPAEGGQAA